MQNGQDQDLNETRQALFLLYSCDHAHISLNPEWQQRENEWSETRTNESNQDNVTWIYTFSTLHILCKDFTRSKKPGSLDHHGSLDSGNLRPCSSDCSAPCIVALQVVHVALKSYELNTQVVHVALDVNMDMWPWTWRFSRFFYRTGMYSPGCFQRGPGLWQYPNVSSPTPTQHGTHFGLKFSEIKSEFSEIIKSSNQKTELTWSQNVVVDVVPAHDLLVLSHPGRADGVDIF